MTLTDWGFCHLAKRKITDFLVVPTFCPLDDAPDGWQEIKKIPKDKIRMCPLQIDD